jgi:hypothetical protein
MFCNGKPCLAVPHLMGVATGNNFPPASTSGAGLVLEYFCEDFHHWQLVFEDHSGGTYISCVRFPDLKTDPRFPKGFPCE